MKLIFCMVEVPSIYVYMFLCFSMIVGFCKEIFFMSLVGIIGERVINPDTYQYCSGGLFEYVLSGLLALWGVLNINNITKVGSFAALRHRMLIILTLVAHAIIFVSILIQLLFLEKINLQILGSFLSSCLYLSWTSHLIGEANKENKAKEEENEQLEEDVEAN